MRIIRLQAEGFKRLVAVDITPEGDLIEVRGENGNGKSSVLDAIYAALGGADAAPEMPVREGEEAAVIRLDLGELIVTRYFTEAGTTGLKVTTPDGAAYGSAQTMLDKLVGAISFDPLEFLELRPEEQAEELRKLVTIADPKTGEVVDLKAIEEANAADYAKRRDVNRDGKTLAARIEAMGGVRFVPDDAPDRAAIVAAMQGAAETNAAIERERADRDRRARLLETSADALLGMRERATALRNELMRLEEDIAAKALEISTGEAELGKLPPLDEPVDVADLSAQLEEADRIAENVRVNEERARLMGEFAELKRSSEAHTVAMTERNAKRAAAIAAAQMPVEGLALDLGEDGKLGVLFAGVPFSQASDAERLRVSAAVAMAANPTLRVLRLKNASLLDKRAVETLRGLATDNDFQIWAEFVGDEGPGIIMEAGEVRGADKPEPLPKPRQRKKDEPEAREGESVSHGTTAGGRGTCAARRFA
jgi:RecA/RadA recombinase